MTSSSLGIQASFTLNERKDEGGRGREGEREGESEREEERGPGSGRVSEGGSVRKKQWRKERKKKGQGWRERKR